LSLLAAGAFLSAALALPGSPSGAYAGSTAGGILAQRLPEVKFQGVAFADCIDFIRDVTNANIHVNWRALEAAGISKDTQVNIRLREVPLRKALDLLLSEAGGSVPLSYQMDDGIIEITTAEIADKQLLTRVYSVEDLIVEVPDFDNPPDLSLTATSTGGSGGKSSGGGKSGGGGGAGGGGGGAGGGLFGGAGAAKTTDKVLTRTERADQLVEMIREIIRPEIW